MREWINMYDPELVEQKKSKEVSKADEVKQQTEVENIPEESTQEVGNNSNDSEKIFTQQELNKIVQDRLARQKSKMESEFNTKIETELAERVKALDERENKLHCANYLLEQRMPYEYLSILDTSNFDDFKRKADIAYKVTRSQPIAPLKSVEKDYKPEKSGFDNDKHEPRDYSTGVDPLLIIK